MRDEKLTANTSKTTNLKSFLSLFPKKPSRENSGVLGQFNRDLIIQMFDRLDPNTFLKFFRSSKILGSYALDYIERRSWLSPEELLPKLAKMPEGDANLLNSIKFIEMSIIEEAEHVFNKPSSVTEFFQASDTLLLQNNIQSKSIEGYFLAIHKLSSQLDTVESSKSAERVQDRLTIVELKNEPWFDIIQVERSVFEHGLQLKESTPNPNVVGQLNRQMLTISKQAKSTRFKNLIRPLQLIINQRYNLFFADENRIRSEFLPYDIDQHENFLPYIEDYERIRSLLIDPKAVLELLEPLEAALLQKLNVNDSPSQKYNILKQLLAENEANYGFTMVRLIPLGVIPAESFLDIVSRGILFEDIGAGVGHGPLSHRFQWYAITQSYEKNKGAWHHDPSHLYRQLGTAMFSAGQLTKRPLWAFLLDQDQKKINDFRHPMTIQSVLTGNPNYRHGQKNVNFIDKVPFPAIQSALFPQAIETWLQYPKGSGLAAEPSAEMIQNYHKEYTEKKDFIIIEQAMAEYSRQLRKYFVLLHQNDIQKYKESKPQEK